MLHILDWTGLNLHKNQLGKRKHEMGVKKIKS